MPRKNAGIIFIFVPKIQTEQMHKTGRALSSIMDRTSLNEPDITARIRTTLKKDGIAFLEIDHEPVTTCEQSAKARGCDQKIGGKSILLKDKSDFRIFVISASLQINSKKVRKILGSSWLRFATAEELQTLAGVEKGALPPFGRDVLPFDLYLDESILRNNEIAFNAGMLTKSFVMKVKDYLKLVDPIICDFAK
jgi:Ala-tRNA(Pro) deacylase